jgi:hypothetical protein
VFLATRRPVSGYRSIEPLIRLKQDVLSAIKPY